MCRRSAAGGQLRLARQREVGGAIEPHAVDAEIDHRDILLVRRPAHAMGMRALLPRGVRAIAGVDDVRQRRSRHTVLDPVHGDRIACRLRPGGVVGGRDHCSRGVESTMAGGGAARRLPAEQCQFAGHGIDSEQAQAVLRLVLGFADRREPAAIGRERDKGRVQDVGKDRTGFSRAGLGVDEETRNPLAARGFRV